MAKRTRQRDPINDTDRPDTSRPGGRSTRRSRPVRTVRERSLLERYSGVLVMGLGVLGVLVIVFFLFQGGARGAYQCETLLTPGPVESVPPAQPDPIGSPSPAPAGSPSPDGSPAASPGPAPDPTPRLGFTTADLGRGHVRDPGQIIDFGFCPPTSGDHWSIQGVGPIRPGFYPQTQEQAPGGWVHNLEHGYVIALYRCASDDDCPTQAELDQLRRFTEEAPGSSVNPACSSKVIAARFDEMDTRFAMLAWGRALLMDNFDLDTAFTFAEQWIDHEAVPERGLC